MANCEICKKKLGVTFLQKIIGTVVKDAKGKMHPICNNCQKNLQSKEKMLENL